MGVTGLWRLIDPAGKPVPVETLENKVLAVDISIWLHQVVKGYQDAKGAPLPNAHLMGLFQRLCKLLYFRIKPVFVFDGGVPDLKWQTIAKRQDNKLKYNSESERLKRELALLIGKKTAIGALLGKQISPKKNVAPHNDDDMFKLPALPQKDEETETESDDDDSSSTSASTVDLHSVDLESQDFKSMPVKEKYDLLLELKETRKMNSWGKLHTLPKKSDNFSDFQMQRLLKRRKVQECIEETEKEMGDVGMSFNDLETLLNEDGIDTKIEQLPTRRIASDQRTRFLLISNDKKTDSNKQMELNTDTLKESSEMIVEKSEANDKTDELEDDLQRAIKMSLECMNEPVASTSTSTSKCDESWTSYMTDSEHSDEGQDDYIPEISSAKAYIMQYSDFTHKAIDDIVSSKVKHKNTVTQTNVEKIIQELNAENSVIEDKVDISSEEENADTTHIEGDISTEIIPLEPNKTENEKVIKIKENNSEEFDENKTNENNSSIICIGTNNDSIINLDTTSEDCPNTVISSLDEKSKISSSSDDDFEEVSDTEKKPIVQLTLDMNEPIEDDIFADVFEVKNECVSADLPDFHKKSEHIEDTKEVKDNFIAKKPTLTGNCKVTETEGKILASLSKEEPNNIVSTSENEHKTIDNLTSQNTNVRPEIITSDASKISNMHEKESIQENHNNMKAPAKPIVTEEMLQSMETEINDQQESLLQEKGKLDRAGRNISEEMTRDAQELLQVFGIPYIVAPMEAEAQCAFLESAKLTDGTITDDSDIWLFGGRTVYKNFFNQKKHVLQFLSERIERSFNLTREQLILLALLVGSDYTTGVTGVGPVTALEILASFPFNKKKFLSETSKQAQYQEIIKGLQEFKQWVRAGKRTDNISLKKKLKNVKLNDDFPSVRVVQAYLEPNIEKSEEKFTWGEIDITILRDYTKKKFGWSQSKLDEIINPVLKRLQDRKNQKTVHDYFKHKVEFQPLVDEQVSKRVKAAIMKMDPNATAASSEEVVLQAEKVPRKNKSGTKRKSNKDSEINNISKVVKVTSAAEKESDFNIIIPKTDKCQEIIPQREKAKQNLLENKLKAIEIYRKTKIDKKRKLTKRKAIKPKDKAELSESSESN